jgi:hypothetical protein
MRLFLYTIRCVPAPRNAIMVDIVAAIVQWQNAALWQRMSWVRNPLAAPKLPLRDILLRVQPTK